MGAPSRRRATSSAWARMRPISSAFCSPVEHSRAGMRLRRVGDEQIGAVRAIERAPGGPVALAPVAQALDVGVLDLDRGQALEIGFERAFEREGRGGKRRMRIARRALGHERGERGDGLGARRGDGDARLRHEQFEPFEARGIAHAVGEQAVALLHGALETRRRWCDSRGRSRGSDGRGSGAARSRGR